VPAQPFLIAAMLAFSANGAFDIPPVSTSLNISGQAVALTISGDVSGGNEPSVHLNLRADLTDFQNHLTPILQAELNRSEQCGERISIGKATLVPAAPAGRLTVELHVEKWACFKAFGKENAKRLVGGNATVQVLLTPRVEQPNAVRLEAEVGDIEADGSLGQLLHSGSVGPALRDKIRDALLKAVQKPTDFNNLLPEQARSLVTLQSAAFQDAGDGHLALKLTASTVPAILEQFRR
jgi:hypothetical protein